MTKRRSLLSNLLRSKGAEDNTTQYVERHPVQATKRPENPPLKRATRVRASKNSPKIDYVAILRAQQDAPNELSENELRNLEILKKRASGQTLEEIGQEYSMTREAIRQIVSKCGGVEFKDYAKEVKAKKLTEIEKDIQIIRDYVLAHPGITPTELEIEFNLPQDEILRRLTKFEKKLVSGSKTYRDKTRYWSDEMILDALRLAQTYHYPLKISDYHELITVGEIKGPSVPLIATRFKTWKQACIAAGVEYVESYTTYAITWTRDDLVEIVEQYLMDSETSGTIDDYNRWRDNASDRIPSLAQIRIVVGPWSEACDEALSNIRSNSWDRPDVI